MFVIKQRSIVVAQQPFCWDAQRFLLVVHNRNCILSPAHPVRCQCFCVQWPEWFRLWVHTVGRGSEVLQSHFEYEASRHTTYHDLAILRPEASQSTQPRASSSAAPPRPPPTAETQAGKQTRVQLATGLPATQAQSVQEEGSGYMSTESDSDTGTKRRTQVCFWQFVDPFCIVATIGSQLPMVCSAEEGCVTWCSAAYQGI